MRQRELTGKEWTGHFMGELRGGFKATVPKICPRKNSAL
jgi:hypothetical protein